MGELRSKTSIIGVGMTRFGSVLDTPEIKGKTAPELIADAVFEALEDAGLEPKDIDAFYIGHYLPNTTHLHSPFQVADWIGQQFKPGMHFAAGCATTNVGAGLAAMSIASGVYETVLVVGFEILTGEVTINPAVMKPLDSAKLIEWIEWGTEHVYTYQHFYDASANYEAIPIIGYAKKYGVSVNDIEDALCGIAVCSRRNAHRNPKAYMQDELEEVAKKRGFKDVVEWWRSKYNPYVTYPLRAYNIPPAADGAAAFIVTTAKNAKKCHEKPIDIIGFGWSCDPAPFYYEDPSEWPLTTHAFRDAYKIAKIEPKDIDYLAIGDCSNSEYFIAPEAAGYFEKGEAWKYYRDNKIAFDGDKPINTNGGHLSMGNPASASPAADLYEAVKQMRGEADQRQIKPEPRTVVWHSSGIGSITPVTVLKRNWG
ncbi:MAG: thiolase family protein [Candidatus Bathyarchaeia archaeon]